MTEDRINPSYYQKGICSCGKKLQTYDFVREMPYPDASAIKYICRHREKNGAEDIKKAIWFLHAILIEEYGEMDEPGSK